MSAFGVIFTLKTQIEKDSTEERSSRFSFLISKRPLLRFFYGLLSAAPMPVRALLSLIYASGVSAPRADFGDGFPVAVEKYANERKQIDFLWPVLAARGFQRWTLKPAIWSSLFYFGGRGAGSPSDAAKLYRIAKKLCRRYPLFAAMRAMESVLSYFYAREMLREKRIKIVVSSSDGNPYGRALMAAAHAEGVPLVFVSHGAVAEAPVRAKISLAVLHGQAAAEDFLGRGSEISELLLFGFRRAGGINRLDQVRRVLICLGAAPNLGGLRVLVNDIHSRFPSALLVVRLHPHSQAGNVLSAESARRGGWEISSAAKVSEDLARSDLMVAANSTVHLDALAAGVPSLYAPGLDPPGVRPLSFIREGLVAGWGNSEGVADINEHYSAEDYSGRLGKYMSQEKTREEFIREFERHMDGLLRAGRKPTSPG